MATIVLTASPTPVKLADAGQDFFISVANPIDAKIEIATTDTPGTAPTSTVWHPIRGDWGGMMNRQMLSSTLEVWVRCNSGTVEVPVER